MLLDQDFDDLADGEMPRPVPTCDGVPYLEFTIGTGNRFYVFESVTAND